MLCGWVGSTLFIEKKKERERETETKKFCQKQWTEASVIKIMKKEQYKTT